MRIQHVCCLECKVTLYLNAADLQNFDFRLPVYIEDEGAGDYYHVQRLEYDAANFTGKVKAELIKVINPVPRVQLTENSNESTYLFPPVFQQEVFELDCTVNDTYLTVKAFRTENVGGEVIRKGGLVRVEYNG